jgi:hypothetical protein
MRLEQRLKKIEDAARPMIDDRECRINNYIAECAKRGLETPRQDAEEADAFMEVEMAMLQHLPWQERLKQAGVSFAIYWYRKKTGKSEQEARAAIIPYLEHLDREQLEIENQQD